MEENRWKDYSREDLVIEYIETSLANLVNHIGIEWHWMPTDVSQDPIYWKSKNNDLHNMHIEIAKRYHISRYDCLWLENIVDNTNLYLTERKLKPIIRDAIKKLEETEKKKMEEERVVKYRAKKVGSKNYIRNYKSEDVACIIDKPIEDVTFRGLAKKIALAYPKQDIVLYVNMDGKDFKKASKIWQNEFDVVMKEEFNERRKI